MYVSVIIPVYNEEESIPHLGQRLFPVLDRMSIDYEVIAVNDGSRDESFAALLELCKDHSRMKVVSFARNFGQTAAMMAGIDHASGDVIVSMDADLQNDPEDIPNLLAKLEEGFDLVSGWRRDRKDAAIRRNLVSRVANRAISRVSGVRLNDYGCTLKAYRRHVIKGVRLYGEMHRFIPIYASWMGARITQIPVNHHARQFGHSKYGLERIAKVILDLMVVQFLHRHLVKPIYVFGGFAFLSWLISGLSVIWAIALKVLGHTDFILTPLPLLAAMSFLIGFMSLLMGLIAEILTRTYYESQDRRTYLVRDLVNFPN